MPAGSELASLVGSAFGTAPDDLLMPGRGPAPVALARQVAIYLAHTKLRLSLTSSAALFGRDRTTAAHACRQVEDRREQRHFDLLIDCLERAVDGAACSWIRQR
jgi:chromosomal replication initiation ATPase DnaA